MPEIESISRPEEEQNEQEQKGFSQEEIDKVVAEFEARIESGDWSGKPFHAVVKEELFPLIGEGALNQRQFARLVQKWAGKNHPFDWPSREDVFKEAEAK
jgi:hypothetical protein